VRFLGEAARSHGSDHLRFTRTQAIETPERIALESGLVGLTARLAKARRRCRRALRCSVVPRVQSDEMLTDSIALSR
jgi:hypothetical protein